MAWIKTRVTDDGDTRFVACYRDPEGRQRSAGTYPSRRAAERAAHREEARSPRRRLARPLPRPGHLRRLRRDRLAALQARRDLHPGRLPLLPRQALHPRSSADARWARSSPPRSSAGSPPPAETASRRSRSRKYHAMLASVFERALRDRVITFNPCAHTELPKMVKKKARTLTPDEYDRLLAALPAQHRLMIETADQHRPALGRAHRPQAPPPRPPTPRQLTVEETIVEVSQQELPHRRNGCSPSPTPKTTNPAPWPSHKTWSPSSPRTSMTSGLGPRRPAVRHPRRAPPSRRNTFRTRIWLPAVEASGVDFDVRVHDLRHAHASWLLAGGSDIKSVMDRMGHAQITTTQQYLHTLPDADHKNLTALDRTRNSRPETDPTQPD